MSLEDLESKSVLAGAILFTYTVMEVTFVRMYRRSVEKCLNRLIKATETYRVPEHVSEDICKQFGAMTHVKTWYRDLFECEHHGEIHRGNLTNFLSNTMGAAQPVISYLINMLESELSHQFPQGYNEKLQHAYCREDSVIRSVYLPAFIKFPLVAIKYGCDMLVRVDYTMNSTEHVVYWTFRSPIQRDAHNQRALLFLCGIGIGPITYFYLLKHFYAFYDVIVVVEIKWISFHLSADPVEDGVLLKNISEHVHTFFKDHPSFNGISKNSKSLKSNLDFMAHSGGALYFKRLCELISFHNKILIEPACFMYGCSTATRQIFTYNTFNPLFQDPLIKNLPKLLDIPETVLLTNTDTSHMILVLSENDTLFNPLRAVTFIETYHPSVPIIMVPNSKHGDAVAKHYDFVAKLIVKKLGFQV